MTITVQPIRKPLTLAAAALLSAGCATSDPLASRGLANAPSCPGRMVLVCSQPSSLLSTCGCATRDDFYLLMGQR